MEEIAKKPAKYVEFTQCGVASDVGPKCTPTPSLVTCVAPSAVYLDTKRGCYGTRWRMPAAYLVQRESTRRRSLETIYLSVNVPELTPGPGDRFAVYTEIEIRQKLLDWVPDPASIVEFDARPGVEPTGETIRGMQVFANVDNIGLDLVLIPTHQPKYFLYCSVSKRKGYTNAVQFLGARDELTGCHVEQHIGPGLYARYYIRHQHLDDVEHIASSMQALFDSFMVE